MLHGEHIEGETDLSYLFPYNVREVLAGRERPNIFHIALPPAPDETLSHKQGRSPVHRYPYHSILPGAREIIDVDRVIEERAVKPFGCKPFFEVLYPLTDLFFRSCRIHWQEPPGLSSILPHLSVIFPQRTLAPLQPGSLLQRLSLDYGL